MKSDEPATKNVRENVRSLTLPALAVILALTIGKSIGPPSTLGEPADASTVVFDPSPASATATIQVHVNIPPPHPGAVRLTVHGSGATIGVLTGEILRWAVYSPTSVKIDLRDGSAVYVSETWDQVRIKLQNTGWVVF